MSKNFLYSILQCAGKQILVKRNYWYLFPIKPSLTVKTFTCFNKILLLKRDTQFQIGHPFLKHGIIISYCLQRLKTRKILVLKRKIKKGYLRHYGYRTQFNRLKVL